MKKNAIKNLFKILILSVITVIFVAGCVNTGKNVNPLSEITIDTKVYFADKNEDSLIGKSVSYKVNNESEKYMTALGILIEGPGENGCYPAVNPKTKVLSVEVSKGNAVVDFSESFLEYNTGGSSGEYLCIYAIVNSLCEFNEINTVSFTVNGEKIETFGHFDMTEPYEKDLSMTK